MGILKPMKSGRRFLAATLAAATQLFACSSSNAPAPPSATPPSGNQPIRGSERIGWDQRANDAAELATLGYAIYVDGARTVAAGVSCATPASATGFACSAALPMMAPGAHTLTVAAFNADGLESPQSSQILVTVVGTASSAPPVAPTAGNQTPASIDGAPLRVETLAGRVDSPNDLTVLPDGRLLIADRSGIRIAADGRLVDEPAYTLGSRDTVLAIAVDGDYSRNHFVYVAGTSPSRGGEPAFWLARLREAGNRLGERAVLLDGVPAVAGSVSASLRMGPDGNLYVSFDDGGDVKSSGDLGSFNGKLLRLKTDGTTPRDQSPPTPVYVAGIHSPRGLDWDPMSGSLWLADAQPASKTGRLNSVAEQRSATARRAAIEHSYAMSAQAMPSAMTFYRGTTIPQLTGALLVAAETNRGLLRVQFEASDRTRVRSTGSLLGDVITGARAMTVGRDGRLYVATRDSIVAISGM